VQGDVNSELADFPDDAFDVVVLSQSLQMLEDPKAALAELLRLAPKAVVSVPNFGHYKNRLYLALKGKMPVTKTLSYQWYDTPNIHFCTIADFVELCEQLGITIEKRLMVSREGHPSKFRGKGWAANLLGQQGVFVLRR
jgi:methionine biosynthesis protein MetW